MQLPAIGDPFEQMSRDKRLSYALPSNVFPAPRVTATGRLLPLTLGKGFDRLPLKPPVLYPYFAGGPLPWIPHRIEQAVRPLAGRSHPKRTQGQYWLRPEG